MSYKDQPITVWVRIRTEERVCEYGGKHHITICAPKRLGPVVGTRVHDNGYERRETALRQDYQGRIYHQHFTVDYHDNIYWLRDGDKKMFVPRLPYNGVDVTKELKWQG